MAFSSKDIKIKINNLNKGRERLREELKKINNHIQRDIKDLYIMKPIIDTAIEKQDNKIVFDLFGNSSKKDDIITYTVECYIGTLKYDFSINTIEVFDAEKDINFAFKKICREMVKTFKDIGMGKVANIDMMTDTAFSGRFALDITTLKPAAKKNDMAKYTYELLSKKNEQIGKDCSVLTEAFEDYVLSPDFEDTLSKIFIDLRSTEISIQLRVDEVGAKYTIDDKDVVYNIANIKLTDQDNKDYFKAFNDKLFLICAEINCECNESVSKATALKDTMNNCLLVLLKKLETMDVKVSAPKKLDLNFNNKHQVFNISLKLKR